MSILPKNIHGPNYVPPNNGGDLAYPGGSYILADGNPIHIPDYLTTGSTNPSLTQLFGAAEYANNNLSGTAYQEFIAQTVIYGGPVDIQRPNGADGSSAVFYGYYTQSGYYLTGAFLAAAGLAILEGAHNFSTGTSANQQEMYNTYLQGYDDYAGTNYSGTNPSNLHRFSSIDPGANKTDYNNVNAIGQNNIPAAIAAVVDAGQNFAHNHPFEAGALTAAALFFAPEFIASMVAAAVASVAYAHYEPLVFDLGSGIQTTTLSNGVQFDEQNNGFTEQTAWVGSNTGILVYDPTGGSITNGSQLFGTSTPLSGGGYAVDGFSALAAITDSTSVVNSSSTNWSNLYIWVGGDGTPGSGALETMAEAGIASISLTTVNADTTDANGNYIGKTSAYSLAGGGTHEVADVSFETNPANTLADSSVSVSGTIAGLPDISGLGTVYNLQQAIQIQTTNGDTTLETDVENFVTATNDPTRNTLVDEIIYQWTGIESVSSTSRGSYFNAQELGALEAFDGQSFIDPYNGTANPGQQSVAILTAAYQQLHDFVLASLEAQTNLSGLFNSLVPTIDGGTGAYDWDFSAVEAKILSNLSANRIAGLTNLADFNQALHALGMDTGEGFQKFQSDLATHGSDIAATFLNGTSVIDGTAGSDIITAWAGNQTVIAGQGGNDTLMGGVDNSSLYVSNGGDNETFYGSTGSNLFIGGVGDNEVFYGGNNALTREGGNVGTSDTFIAGQGIETFKEDAWGSVTISYAAGDGNLTISNFNDFTHEDIIVLDSSISRSNVSLSATSPYLGFTITDGVTGDVITITNHFIDKLEFADGTTINMQASGGIQRATSGASLTSTVIPVYTNLDTIYSYSAGTGYVTLNAASGNNQIWMGAGITASDLSYTTSGNDLLITDGISGDQIDDINRSVQTILFADNTTQNLFANDSASGLSGAGSAYTLSGGTTTTGTALNDTYAFASGTGSATINEAGGQNALLLGSGITSGDLTFTAAGDDLLITNGVSGDQIDIKNQIGGNPAVQTAEFSDSSTIKLSGLVLNEASGYSIMNGSSAGNDTLIGNNGTQTLNANGGGDTFINGTGNTTARGGIGGDTFSYASGSGDLTIVETGGLNQIVLGSGITTSDISLAASGSNLLLTDGVSGDQITIDNQLGPQAIIDSLVFTDGSTTESLANIALTMPSGASVLNGTLGDDTLTATAGTETLISNGGNYTFVGASGTESLIGNRYAGNNTFIIGTGVTKAYGGAGNNVYSYASGDGNLKIYEGGGQDSIVLASGLTSSDLTFAAAGSNLIITDGVSGDQITLENQLSSTPGVQEIVFSGGSSESLESGLTLTLYSGDSVLNGPAGNGNTLIGATGTQTLVANGGNDTFVTGTGTTTIIGNKGGDTISYASGDGNLIIEDNSGTNTIFFGTGITTGDVSWAMSGSSDLILTDSTTGDQITIDNQLSSEYGITSLVFSGGTTESLEGLNLTMPSGATTLNGTVGNDTLTATAGTEVLNGNGGNDTFVTAVGDITANGGSGNDVFSYASGDGNLSIDQTGGSSTLVLGTGLTASNVIISEASDGDSLLITDGVTGDVITLYDDLDLNQFGNVGGDGVASIIYGDGSTLSFAAGMTLYAYSGNSVLNALGGVNTTMIAVNGTGTESINGNSGNDTYSYSSGNGAVFIGISKADFFDISTDTIKLGNGLTASNTWLGEASYEKFELTDTTTGDLLEFDDGGAQTILYGDGSTLNLSSVLADYPDTINSGRINGTSGNDVILMGAENVTINGGGGSDTYDFGRGMGTDYINNGASNSNAPAGTLHFGNGIADDQLWFDRVDFGGNISSSGDNLRITIMGTSTQITINNEFNSSFPYSQLSEFELSDGTVLDTGLNDLMSAMTTFEADYLTSHGTNFDPTNTINTTITDSTVLAAVNDDYNIGAVQSGVSYTLPVGIRGLELTGTLGITGTGNTGNDVLTSNSGADTLIGNSSVGADTFIVNNASDSVTETNPGTAGLVEASVNWTLGTNLENLTLIGTGNLTGTGNTNGNILTSNSGVDVLIGNSTSGDDTFVVNNTGDSLTEANISSSTLVKSSVNWTLGANFDNLDLIEGGIIGTGNTSADVLNDNGGIGSDTLIGNSTSGADTFVVNSINDSVTETHSGSAALVESTVNWTLGTNIENLTFVGSANVTGTGNSGSDVLTGNSANDVLNAGTGVDTLIGNSTIGADTFVVNSTVDSVTENNSGTGGLVQSNVSWTLGPNLENLTLIGSSNLTGVGNSLANVLISNTGVDALIGNSSSGADTFVLNNTGDTVTETNSGTVATVVAGFNYTLGANLEELILTGSSNLVGTGNSLSDVLVSNAGVDTLIGNSTAGTDTFVLNNTNDLISETHSGTGTAIVAGFNYTLGASMNQLTLTGSSALSGTGNSAADVIIGNTGADVLSDGGSGSADTLIGNSQYGFDTFIVNNTGDSLTETTLVGSYSSAQVISSVDWTLALNFESLTLTGSGLTAIGNSNFSVLSDDGGIGADTLIGESLGGVDAFYVNNTGNSVTEVNPGTDYSGSGVTSSVDWTLGANIRELYLTGSNLVGAGYTSDAILHDSGVGADTLIGNSTDGGDEFIVNNTADSITEVNGGGDAFVVSTVNITMGTNLVNLEFDDQGDDEGDGIAPGNLTGIGNNLNDYMIGNTGNDLFNDGSLGGADTFVGYSRVGSDTFIVNNTSDSITEANGGGAALVESSVDRTLDDNISQLTLIGSGNVSGAGNSLDNIITVNNGADTLTGGTGSDTFVIGSSAGNDFITNYDVTKGDIIRFDDSVSDLTGARSGNDLIVTLSNSNTLTLSDFFDSFTGTSENLTAEFYTGNPVTLAVDSSGNITVDNLVTGDTGNDTLIDGGNSASGAFTLIGNSTDGLDVFNVNDTGDSVTETNLGYDGAEVISSVNWTLSENNVNSIVLAGANLVATGNTNDDSLTDEDGAGADTLIGNSTDGEDVFYVSNTGDSVTETNLGENGAEIYSSVSYTLVNNVNSINLTAGNIAATGNSADDYFGDDGVDADTLIGNSTDGGDTFYVNNKHDSVIENVGGGVAAINSSVNWTLSANINQLNLDSANLVGIGNTNNDILSDDYADADTLIGNSYNGSDTFYVNNTGTSITEANGGGEAIVYSSVNWTLANNIDQLTLTGAGLVARGNTGTDILSDDGVDADTLIGDSADGNDTFTVNNTNDSVTEIHGGGAALVKSSVDWTLGANINNLTLTGSNDLTGTANTSNDVLTANDGNDVLVTGTGADTLVGSVGADTFEISATAGNVIVTNYDSLKGDVVQFDSSGITTASNLSGARSGNNVVLTLPDSNTVTLSGFFDSFTGSSEDLIVAFSSGSPVTLSVDSSGNVSGSGGSGAVVTGGSGDETLSDGGAGAGNYTLIGNSTNRGDYFEVNNTGDSVTETNSGSGTSTVISTVNWTLGTNLKNLNLSGSGNITGTGNSLGNYISGNSGNDVLVGGTGNSELDDGGNGGADTLIGNSTTRGDKFDVNNTADSLTETNSGSGASTVYSSVNWTLGTNFKNLNLIGSGNITGTGNSLGNYISGNSGNDVLIGGAGNSELDDGDNGGADTLIGNSTTRSDQFDVNNTADSLTETNSGSGASTVYSSVNWTLGTNFKNLTMVGSGNITGTGNSLGNYILGNSGNDHLIGGIGNSELDDGDNGGADTLIGNSTNGGDQFDVNNTADSVTETNSGSGTSTVNASVNWTLGANFKNLNLSGSGNLTGTGNSLGNYIAGNSGNDVLNDGGSGAVDTLEGNSSSGSDTFIVNNTGDHVTENMSGGAALIDSSVSFTLVTNVNHLTLTGSGNITGTGNSAADVITGNNGNDVLSVGTGTGADTLIGNSSAGADTFVINNTGDTLTEANSGTAALVNSSVNWTLGTHFEKLTLTGSSSLTGTGNSSANVITGNTGSDVLNDGGAGGSDTLVGNSTGGNDTFTVNNTGDSLTETNGGTAATVNSNVNWTLGSHMEKLILTGSSSLTGTGNSAAALITGNTGNDVLSVGTSAGVDTLIGNSTAGADTFIINNAGDSLTETNSGTAALVSSTANWTLGTNFEDLTFTGSGGLKGIGNTSNDIFTSNTGADTFVGNSTAGADTFVVTNTSDSLTETNSGAGALVESSVNWTLGSNLENLTLLGSSNLVGTGNSLANVLTDNGHTDTLIGGAGNDTYFVTNATDAISEASAAGTDLVESTVTYALSANVENLTLLGTSNINGTGGGSTGTITGNSANNVLSDGHGIDTMAGGTGDDTYIIYSTSDVITENVSEGIDTVQFSGTGTSYTLGANLENLSMTDYAGLAQTGIGNTLDNVITDGGSSDTLNGAGGNDTITGGVGNDSIIDGSGNDSLDGGAGYSDTISFASATSGVTVDLAANLAGAETVSGDGNDTITNFENIVGSAYNDVLTADGSGSTLAGGAGNDTYYVTNTGDIVSEAASSGTDLVESTVTYTLSANVENLTLLGTSNINGTGSNGSTAGIITGNSGNNILSDGHGIDTMAGGTGNDTYVVYSTGDVITENSGEGTDTVQFGGTGAGYTLGANLENLTLNTTTSATGTGNSLDNIITGSSLNDTLNGAGGNDTIIGGAGSDSIIDGSGNDSLDGGTGYSDTISFASSTSGVTVDLTANLSGAETVSGDGNDTIINFENVVGSAYADVLTADGSGSSLAGGAGNDTYYVTNTGDTITEAASAGTDLVESTVSYTLAANVENLTLLGTANINGTANNGITGSVITGNSGNNILSDGHGVADTMIGGTGNDTYLVYSVADVITENSGEGTDTVQFGGTGTGYTLGANLENLVLNTGTSVTGTGNSLDNVITGGSLNDTLNGAGGNDTIIGGAGADSIIDGSGNDSLDGGSAYSDTISFASATSGVTVDLAANMTGAETVSGDGNDTIINFENVVGSAYNDVLTADGSGSTLAGGTGNDTYYVSNTSDVVSEAASAGTDLVISSVNYTLSSNIEGLTLAGSSTLKGIGNTSNDVLTSNTGVDTLVGNSTSGADTFVVNNTGDSLTETNSGTAALVKSSVNWTLGTHFEALTLTGTTGLKATGNSSNDVLTSNTGIDTLVGNSTSGADTFVVNNAGDSVTEVHSGGSALVDSSVSWTLGTNTNKLTFTGTSALTGIGNSANDVIIGNTAADILSDGFTGGVDTMIGNSTAGNDTFYVSNTADSITETNSGGLSTVNTGVNWTLGTNMQAAVAVNGYGNLTLTANNLNDYLVGNDGNDRLIGGTGNDTLSDGFAGGADTMIGNSTSGNDVFYVSNTADSITETNGGGFATVYTSVNWTLGAHMEGLIDLSGSGNLTATANNLNDYIIGNDGSDVLIGGTGSDTLSDGGLGGADTMVGNGGYDEFIVNNTADSVTETVGGGFSAILSSVNWTMGSHIAVLELTGSGITGTSNNTSDYLTDNSSNGGNTLIGGTSADDFVFQSAGVYNNRDTISNFSTAQSDKIDISALIPGYTSGVSMLADYVQAVNSGSNSLLQVDSTGTGAHFQTVTTITGVTSINVATYVSNANLIV